MPKQRGLVPLLSQSYRTGNEKTDKPKIIGMIVTKEERCNKYRMFLRPHVTLDLFIEEIKQKEEEKKRGKAKCKDEGHFLLLKHVFF
mmetsp:Transcript_11208/g.16535  ORF Transcript_11208/g.16535 Transcript_11208/m.16535 type:complete len:87 (-) Transcript_11208:792-1052(-)